MDEDPIQERHDREHDLTNRDPDCPECVPGLWDDINDALDALTETRGGRR